jgi:hypothetical protein
MDPVYATAPGLLRLSHRKLQIRVGKTLDKFRCAHHTPVVFQKWRWSLAYCPPKSIAVDKQADNEVVHLDRFREADRLADQAFDPCP